MLTIVAVISSLVGLGVLAATALPAFGLLAAVVILLAAGGDWRYRQRLAARCPRAAIALSRLIAVVVLGLAISAAHDLSNRPAPSLILLVAGVFESAALWTADRQRSGDDASAVPSTAARLVTVAIVVAVAVAASYAAVAAVSTEVAPDTTTYWTSPRALLTRTPGVVPIRTPQYSLLFAAVELLGGHGGAFILAQIAIRALSLAVLVWLITSHNLGAGVIVGALLAIDPVSALTSPGYLSESIYTAALTFVTALALWQAATAERRPGRLFAAGLFFGVCLLVRPTSGAFIGLVLLAYAIPPRRALRAVWVAAGYLTIALSIALYQYLRTGLFMIVTAGLFVAFPLFVQHLMDPQNGRASRTIDSQLVACNPQIDYSDITVNTANQFVYTQLLPCTLAQNGHDVDAAYHLYAAAYREALLARPLTAAWRLFVESCRFLGTNPSFYGGQIIGVSRVTNGVDLCARKPPYQHYDPALLAFVCPMPVPDRAIQERFVAALMAMRGVYQPYLYAYNRRLGFGYVPTTPPELLGGAALLYLLLAFFIVRPGYRPLLAGASAVITYNAAATAFGQVTLARYVAPMAPFFLIITGLVCATIVDDVVGLVRGRSAVPQGGRAGAESV